MQNYSQMKSCIQHHQNCSHSMISVLLVAVRKVRRRFELTCLPCIPPRNILIENCCIFKHSSKMLATRNIPSCNITIERFSPLKCLLECFHLGDVYMLYSKKDGCISVACISNMITKRTPQINLRMIKEQHLPQLDRSLLNDVASENIKCILSTFEVSHDDRSV